MSKKGMKSEPRKLEKQKYIYIKRGFDFFAALLLLIIFSPIMLIIAVAIRMDSSGPIFFVQKRSGKNNKIFSLYKFRSMVANNDVRNLEEGDSITKVGNFIRKTSLDELPNIFNILKGEMSFIGPRPWIPEYSLYFSKEQKKRLDVLPGITGYAQSSGRNNLNIYEKIKLDCKYVENISVFLDVKIIFMTIKTVLKRTGIENDKYDIRDEIEELRLQHINNKIRTREKKEIENSISRNNNYLNNKEELVGV